MDTLAECKKQVCDMICRFSSQCTTKLVSCSKGGKLRICVLRALHSPPGRVTHLLAQSNPQNLSIWRGSHANGLSTEAISQCVSWNNVSDLAVGWQQVLGEQHLLPKYGSSFSVSFGIFPLSLTSPFVCLIAPS